MPLVSENALNKAHEGVLMVDDRYFVTFENKTAQRILEKAFGPHKDIREDARLREVFEGKTVHFTDGKRNYETKLEEIRESGYLLGYMIWFLDVTQHLAVLEETRERANHDSLTGLFTRSYFEKLVKDDLAERRAGCFIIFDMDNFKQINDLYGHQRGDRVLRDFAKILLAYPKDRIYASRLGGDEFCVYVRDEIDEEKIAGAMDGIMESFAKTFRDTDDLRCTLSAGICRNRGGDEVSDFKTLYREADMLLYRAKDAGKNKYILG